MDKIGFCCIDCDFSDQVDTGSETYYCRRYPPNLPVDTKNNDAHQDPNVETITVLAGDWCGEWKSKGHFVAVTKPHRFLPNEK